MMASHDLSDLSLDDLWALLRDKVQSLIEENLHGEPPARDLKQSDLSDFPVDQYGSWPEGLTLRREEMYGDAER